MKLTALANDQFQIDLSRDELSIIGAYINEATNLGDEELMTRINVSMNQTCAYRDYIIQVLGATR